MADEPILSLLDDPAYLGFVVAWYHARACGGTPDWRRMVARYEAVVWEALLGKG